MNRLKTYYLQYSEIPVKCRVMQFVNRAKNHIFVLLRC